MLRDDCVKCSECCRVLIFQTRYQVTAENIKFFRMRGVRVRANEKGLIDIEIDSTCPHLSPDGCSIYHKWPDVCRVYDCSRDPAPFKMR